MVRELVENCLDAAERALKLILWLQFLRHRLLALLLRLYAAPWLAALAILSLSAWMLLPAFGSPGNTGRVILVSCCPLVVIAAYALGRLVPLWTAALAVLIPGTMTIAPTVGRTNISLFADDSQLSNYLGTGDFSLFLKGTGACFCLSAISFLLQSAVQSPRTRHWPLRWAFTLTIVASGLLGLEMLRLALHLAPGLRLLWTPPLTSFMSEPGWPDAIAVWLWINTAYLLARYDAKLIPYLLRRTGHLWAPGELSIHETYLVDHLLRQLAYRPPSPGRQETRSREEKQRRPRRGH